MKNSSFCKHFSNTGLARGAGTSKFLGIKTINLSIPGICHAFGRNPKSAVEKVNDTREAIINSAPGQLANLFKDVLPPEIIPSRKGERVRCFSSFSTVWSMIEQAFENGTLRCGRKKKAPSGDDVQVCWKKPPADKRPQHIPQRQWDALPESIVVRYVRFRVERKGFRSKEIIVATTDLKSASEEIAERYLSRWQIELCYRDIKTTMGLDFLRAKSASMARKVFGFGLIAHNLLRIRMHEARMGRRSVKISFAGALAITRRIYQESRYLGARALRQLEKQLIAIMCDECVPDRPGRHEPRVRKRRPKNYPLMIQPRAAYKAVPKTAEIEIVNPLKNLLNPS